MQNREKAFQKPLLSICIPTYNRAEQLRQALESIVGQERFSEIEVVVSDNASTDSTHEVVLGYMKRYQNIKYYRNEENIGCGNLPLALRRGAGCLRKLSNDTILYEVGAVGYMLSMAEKYMGERPLLYFFNGQKVQEIPDERTFDSADSFLRAVGHMVTWIALIAIWEDDCDESCESMRIYEQYEKSSLAQIPYLLEIIGRNGKVVVLNRRIMGSAALKKKNLSYGLYDVFYTNFLGILRNYKEKGILSEGIIGYMKEDLLINFFPNWTAEFEVEKDKYITSGEDLGELLHAEYKSEPYYGRYRRILFRRKLKLRLLHVYRILRRS